VEKLWNGSVKVRRAIAFVWIICGKVVERLRLGVL